MFLIWGPKQYRFYHFYHPSHTTFGGILQTGPMSVCVLRVFIIPPSVPPWAVNITPYLTLSLVNTRNAHNNLVIVFYHIHADRQ